MGPMDDHEILEAVPAVPARPPDMTRIAQEMVASRASTGSH